MVSVKRKQKSVALVISGGGSKGAFAAGIVKYLYEKYRDSGWFSIVGGCSTGALIAPLAALMGGPREQADSACSTLVHFYTHLQTKDILEKKNILEFVQHQDGLNKTGPLKQLIQRIFVPECFQWLQSDEAPECYIVYTNFFSGEKVSVSPKDKGMTHERFSQALLASASVPVLMEPVVIDGEICYDGGVRDIIPFGRAIDLGAETILPLFLDPEHPARRTGSFKRIDQILFRSLAILADETCRNDYEMANLINKGIRARQEIYEACSRRAFRKIQKIFDKADYQELFGHNRRLLRIVAGLRPDKSLTEAVLTFDPQQMRRWLKEGEQKAAEVLTESPF